uniref:G-protein coupled receptors family 1 profile domain-containing protein n=1 Tax=Romanomermis culicivorax TaxID=13658 RepID=A0A915K6L7_ROMCU
MNRSTSQYSLICNVSNNIDTNGLFQQWPKNLTPSNCIPKPRPQKDDFIDILTTGYLFIILFIIGVLGNLLNLMVLNTRHMKSKTNTFLSAMALADLAFFISNLPRCLNTFKFFASSQISKKYYVKTMPLFLMVGNAFSCSSI